MQIQINPGDVQNSEALDQHAREKVTVALRHYAEQVTRVEVHLANLNANKGGVSLRCTIEARLAHHQPLAVEHDAEDMYKAIDLAADKLERAVTRKLERLKRA
jgi:ribosomal subunit interface protein